MAAVAEDLQPLVLGDLAVLLDKDEAVVQWRSNSKPPRRSRSQSPLVPSELGPVPLAAVVSAAPEQLATANVKTPKATATTVAARTNANSVENPALPTEKRMKTMKVRKVKVKKEGKGVGADLIGSQHPWGCWTTQSVRTRFRYSVKSFGSDS